MKGLKSPMSNGRTGHGNQGGAGDDAVRPDVVLPQLSIYEG